MIMNEFYNIKFPDRDSLIKEVERLKHENYNIKKEYRQLEESKSLTNKNAYIVMDCDNYTNMVFTNKNKVQEYVSYNNTSEYLLWYKDLILMDNIIYKGEIYDSKSK
jgi:hypothetical protein